MRNYVGVHSNCEIIARVTLSQTSAHILNLLIKIVFCENGYFSVSFFFSIFRIQFNSEEQWTKALKFMLTNLKWGLAWVSSQFANK